MPKIIGERKSLFLVNKVLTLTVTGPILYRVIINSSKAKASLWPSPRVIIVIVIAAAATASATAMTITIIIIAAAAFCPVI